jgi:hypothetical protein
MRLSPEPAGIDQRGRRRSEQVGEQARADLRLGGVEDGATFHDRQFAPEQ